jgi:hypothetical protein
MVEQHLKHVHRLVLHPLDDVDAASLRGVRRGPAALDQSKPVLWGIKPPAFAEFFWIHQWFCFMSFAGHFVNRGGLSPWYCWWQ